MKLEIISLALIFLSVIVIVLGIVKIHTYPGKVARARGHPQCEAIEVTSLLGLLVFPLWMAALIWAYSGAVVGTLYGATEESDESASSPSTTQQSAPPAKAEDDDHVDA